MTRFAEDGEDFGEVDFFGGLAVVVRQRGADLVAARHHRIVQPADLLNPLPGVGGSDARLRAPLQLVDAIDAGVRSRAGSRRTDFNRHDA